MAICKKGYTGRVVLKDSERKDVTTVFISIYMLCLNNPFFWAVSTLTLTVVSEANVPWVLGVAAVNV